MTDANFKNSDKLTSPFSDDQIEKINNWQKGPGHAFACGEKNCREQDNLLVATTEGMVCSCGAWKQNWVHGCMLEDPYDMFPEGMKKIWKKQGILKVVGLLRANAKK
jgi:hypothetical protein